MGVRAGFSMLLAAVLGIVGLAVIFSRSGNTLMGLALLLVASGLGSYARKARAAHLYRKKMTGLADWAQELGPRGRQERRRP